MLVGVVPWVELVGEADLALAARQFLFWWDEYVVAAGGLRGRDDGRHHAARDRWFVVGYAYYRYRLSKLDRVETFRRMTSLAAHERVSSEDRVDD